MTSYRTKRQLTFHAIRMTKRSRVIVADISPRTRSESLTGLLDLTETPANNA